MNVFIVSILSDLSKKEREMCEFEMDLKNFSVCALIISDDDIISA